MSKTAAVVLAFLSLMLFATASRAQLLPSGNVYVGAAYGDNVDVINRYTFRGWNASFEDFPLSRYTHWSIVVDATGQYRLGVQQYTAQLGPRLSFNYGKWRPFVHIMAGRFYALSDFRRCGWRRGSQISVSLSPSLCLASGIRLHANSFAECDAE